MEKRFSAKVTTVGTAVCVASASVFAACVRLCSVLLFVLGGDFRLLSYGGY
ncbi:hypothetical protein PR003_g27973 [Phytophthora rubi]|uniref:Uncharacterized protein n=1 Tax=Phytophthora rubi TaxID=129364 RepID=A0A6A4C3K2_9STRA|nr:hypothetical protein PR003_g27973 [Phytophthora rubi]